MSPVHVLISDNIADEQYYGSAFTGAIDLYRFRSNVEAFERLTSAGAPIDLLVITANQDSLFNMTAAQLVERLGSPAITGSAYLSGLQVVVVGGDAAPVPGRVHTVTNLDAAIRLIKFGEIEATPMPAAQPPMAAYAPVTVARPNAGSNYQLPELSIPMSAPTMQSELAGSVISAIWDAPEPVRSAAIRPVAHRIEVYRGPGMTPPQVQAQPQRAPQGQTQPHGQPVARRQMPRGTTRLRAGGPAAHGALEQPHVQGGGPAMLFAQPATNQFNEQVGELQPSQPYELKSRGAYQGSGRRSDRMPSGAAISAHSGAPAMQQPPMQQPPQLAAQVQQLVYANQHGHDPMLGWSSQVQQQLSRDAQQQAQAAHVQPMAHQAPMQMQQHAHSPQGYAPQSMAQQQVPQGDTARRKGGAFGRMRDRVREGERAPMAPNVSPAPGYGQAPQAVAAPMHAQQAQYAQPAQYAPPVQQAQPVHYAPPVQQAQPVAQQPIGVATFEAPANLLQRAEAAGDVSFG